MSNYMKTLKTIYDANANKNMFYHISLGLWIIMVQLNVSILALNGYNPNRSTFYVPLVLFMIMLYLSTHWLIVCAFKAFSIMGTIEITSQSSSSSSVPDTIYLEETINNL
jgi:hypothetical protein